MNRNFARALSLVLKHEGGWSDHPSDPGGATMKGVTLDTFKRTIDPDATKDDLKQITNEQLSHIYRLHYWNVVQADQLPSGLDYALFDFAVNSGPARAAKTVQIVVGTKQDGVIGPITLAAINENNPAYTIRRVCSRRLDFLIRLKHWSSFGHGWSRRVKDVERHALEMTDSDQTKSHENDDLQTVVAEFVEKVKGFL